MKRTLFHFWFSIKNSYSYFTYITLRRLLFAGTNAYTKYHEYSSETYVVSYKGSPCCGAGTVSRNMLNKFHELVVRMCLAGFRYVNISKRPVPFSEAKREWVNATTAGSSPGWAWESSGARTSWNRVSYLLVSMPCTYVIRLIYWHRYIRIPVVLTYIPSPTRVRN